MKIKVGDTVKVIAGDERGETGKVIRVLTKKDKVVVEGVNKVFKHVRRSQKNPQGGRLNKEMPIQISNVLLFCSRCNSATRTGSRIAKDGSKERFCRKCSAGLGQLSPAKSKEK